MSLKTLSNEWNSLWKDEILELEGTPTFNYMISIEDEKVLIEWSGALLYAEVNPKNNFTSKSIKNCAIKDLPLVLKALKIAKDYAEADLNISVKMLRSSRNST